MATVITYDPASSQLAPSGKDLRAGLGRIFQQAAPKARVEIFWKLRPNLGEAVKVLYSEKDKINNKAIVHAIIGTILADDPTPDENLIITLNVSIFLFVQHSAGILRDNLRSEDIVDAEVREMQRLVYLNRSFLAMDDPRGLAGVTVPQFGNHDVVDFGGVDCNAKEGQMNVRLREQFITI